MSTPDTWQFMLGGTTFTMRFDYDANGNQIYVGWAQVDSLSSDSSWRIMQQTFNGSNQLTNITWANGSTGFGLIWDNRAAYSYS